MSKRLSMGDSLAQGASDIIVKALLGGLEGAVEEISNSIDWSKFSLKNLFAAPKAKQDPYLPEVIAHVELFGILKDVQAGIRRLDTIGKEIQCEEAKATAEAGRVFLKDALCNILADLHRMSVAGSLAAGGALICFSRHGLDYFQQAPAAIRFSIYP